MNPITRAALATIQAFGEIQNVPAAQLALILAKAKKEMGAVPVVPPIP